MRSLAFLRAHNRLVWIETAPANDSLSVVQRVQLFTISDQLVSKSWKEWNDSLILPFESFRFRTVNCQSTVLKINGLPGQ